MKFNDRSETVHIGRRGVKAHMRIQERANGKHRVVIKFTKGPRKGQTVTRMLAPILKDNPTLRPRPIFNSALS
jgi:hypothetical protein